MPIELQKLWPIYKSTMLPPNAEPRARKLQWIYSRLVRCTPKHLMLPSKDALRSWRGKRANARKEERGGELRQKETNEEASVNAKRYEFSVPSRRNISHASFALAGDISTASFLSLPLEIRRLVYEYVLGGGKAIHLMTTPMGFMKRPIACLVEPEPRDSDQVYTQVLQTCRQIYVEALAIMYTSNVFVSKEGYVPVFPADHYFLPQRIGAIRHLKMYWWFYFGQQYRSRVRYTKSNKPSWQLFWDRIAIHMNLETLELCFKFEKPYEWVDELRFDAPWLEPLHKVKVMKDVILEIQWQGYGVPAPEQEVIKLQSDLREIMTATK